VPDLPRPVEFAVVFPGSIDLGAEISIRFCPRRRTIRITRDGATLLIGGPGDLQHFAHRLDPELTPVFFNESVQAFSRTSGVQARTLRNERSSSAIAKYAEVGSTGQRNGCCEPISWR
jgi:hypothetical protein